jgi:hypothetical protein
MTEKQEGAYVGGLFDRPLYRDWIVWLGSLLTIAGALAPFSASGTPGPIDFIVGGGIWAVLGGFLPAAIRQSRRSRARRRAGQ